MLSDTSKVMWSRFGFYQLIITIIHGDKRSVRFAGSAKSAVIQQYFSLTIN
jgi:hypothetical protein